MIFRLTPAGTGPDGPYEFVVMLGPAIVEQLNLKPVAWPVELRGCARNADLQRPLVANRKLNKHMRKRAVGQIQKAQGAARTEAAQESQPEQLERQKRQQDKHGGQRGLKEQGKAGHEVRFGPLSP